jgi:hypothetical protein
VNPRHQTPARIRDLALPERTSSLGMSVRAAERELDELPYAGTLMDLT